MKLWGTHPQHLWRKSKEISIGSTYSS